MMTEGSVLHEDVVSRCAHWVKELERVWSKISTEGTGSTTQRGYRKCEQL